MYIMTNSQQNLRFLGYSIGKKTIYKPLSQLESNGFFLALDESNRSNGGIILTVSIPILGVGSGDIVMTSVSAVEHYFEALARELQTYATYTDRNREVVGIRFTGLGANLYSTDFIQQLLETIITEFTISNDCDTCIDVDPSLLNLRQIDDLRRLEFNRICIRQICFSEEMLNAIGRRYNASPIEELVQYIRKRGKIALEVVLMYGIPSQTCEDLKCSVERALELSPEVLILEPFMKSNGAKVGNPLLEFEALVPMFLEGVNVLNRGGYHAISSSSFIRDTALANGYLRSNNHSTTQIYGIGVGTETMLDSVYSINCSDVKSYYDRVNADGIGICKGAILSESDKIKRSFLSEIVKNGEVNLEYLAIEQSLTKEEVISECGIASPMFAELVVAGIFTVNDCCICLSNKIYLGVLPSLFETGETKMVG